MTGNATFTVRRLLRDHVQAADQSENPIPTRAG